MAPETPVARRGPKLRSRVLESGNSNPDLALLGFREHSLQNSCLCFLLSFTVTLVVRALFALTMLALMKTTLNVHACALQSEFDVLRLSGALLRQSQICLFPASQMKVHSSLSCLDAEDASVMQLEREKDFWSWDEATYDL